MQGLKINIGKYIYLTPNNVLQSGARSLTTSRQAAELETVTDVLRRDATSVTDAVILLETAEARVAQDLDQEIEAIEAIETEVIEVKEAIEAETEVIETDLHATEEADQDHQEEMIAETDVEEAEAQETQDPQ
jgi:hypothetical protein